MSQLAPISFDYAPALIRAAGEGAFHRYFECFAAQIRNPHTRRAYARLTNPLIL